ncbi:cbb3-type cytochrome c oxidase subunit I [Blastopirellula sp. JC732]|uniref:Cbb3-type cytochrome c oxidase subunit I n=1 Tax=Blastopirellula sediminis TaxID=2894196 RepID=A0A9X1MMR5_9BACT|nr:cbb3-type cytochrome c oxidase subunit I [Blastopirellula sediminis]MCC9608884.1 cbb3-type cytochrome c oxidase subunit I [Blastopirellula sediminis]MCC9628339.1 cbb3-type cytochrome c oxidase subunit I [Blastopirellula sediminis]
MSVGATPDRFQAADAGGHHDREDNYLLASSGIGSWLFTLDHKRIGVMYLVGIMASFFLGGIFALVLRAELFTGQKLFLSEDAYNQMFTLHGAVMTFLFIIPSIPAALGNFVLPMMLGQKDVAFPRMNLASFYLWVIGAIFFLAAIIFGGLDTGWTFYTPYSVTTNTRVILALLGVFVLGFSSIFTGLNFVVTINTMRPHGMTWFKMPLFLWATYATAIIQLLATPVLGITGLLLIAERALRIGIFDPEIGGDPVLFQHFFWFYSHPAVYIMILPAMGIISELVAVFSRKHIFGYRFIAYSSIAIALLGFLVWGHHMFVSGQSQLAAVVFSGLTFSVSIPSAIKVFNWTSTMYKGSISLATPMCYALAFIFLFTIGGLTGLFLGALATDVQLHDTYFVVAHFHYVMMGGTLVAFVGGLYYWWPKMFGVMYNENAGRFFSLIVFLGFNLTFFPQFIMGSRGMPRRYARYVDEFQIYHQLSTMGAFLLGIGMVGAIAVLIYSLYRGKKAPANPWGANTLEWMCSSPPPLHNFETPPPVGDPYDYSNLRYDEREGGYVVDPGSGKKTYSH